MSTDDERRDAPGPRQEARVRRSPRYGRFFALGAMLGVVVAMVVSLTWSGGFAPEAGPGGATYSQTQIFGFLLLYCIAGGLLFGGLVGLIADRVVGRKTRAVSVEHDRIYTVDDHDASVAAPSVPDAATGSPSVTPPSTTPSTTPPSTTPPAAR